MALCQQCGRPANYVRKNSGKYKGSKRMRATTGRPDHDLCRRCWHKVMESINQTERNTLEDEHGRNSA